ncbi:MAG: UDP-N-acetylmuramoyl-L-alanyl-D-glutamate--2,6-diaminopimelate ligase [Bacteriovoracaceae bacterium]|jgi:UDP-N-acetylmuramoyl-L-alanyl-D-glutamate--2,6-diaminopimelate ligase|nr:UDP-N-acetylmuramoyl-L-alanyl-D-glutamate--2,6-diaminopimelate ligase [Bacteriovoracaceae bacterium]
MNNYLSLKAQYKFNNVQWKTSDCNSNSILFYNITDSRAVETFKKRISNLNYSCIVYCYPKKIEKIDASLAVSKEEYLNLMKEACDDFHPMPIAKLIGITGTNGKTSTVDFIRQICIQNNIDILTIGTLGVYYNENLVESFGQTSPSFIDLRKYLNKYASASVVAMEVSSHALAQKRFYKLKFDICGWTSFSQDHLDYHNTMEEYFYSKLQIRNLTSEKILVCKSEQHIYKNNKNDFEIVNKEFRSDNLIFKVSYNQTNLTIAISCLEKIINKKLLIHIDKIKPADGRFNCYNIDTNLVIIDYAHTPDAIESILKEIKKSFDKRIVMLFGCGGNRDRLKRPLMGQAACRGSDYVYVTSDNPRFEEPEQILADIKSGIKNYNNFEVIQDRTEAILKCLSNNKDSIIVIAGKGNENYMDVKGKKYPYSDERVIKGQIK